ncbi:DUF4286 family protein [Muricoccus aerilatus]|uniref:DUF4286 family protein n=1 Tax=Muricoccus aerilatus TaxID=452982 RepID=UPI0005C12D4F|nr:DUF4286 family protein [Roseomonas aerilata]
MQGTTILFSEMTPPPGREEEFHAWYDEEHVPLRVGVPGFVSARRYRDTGEGAKGFLAVYEMDAPDVLRSAAYEEVKGKPSALTRDMLASVSGFTRYIGQEMAVRRRAEGDAPAALDAPLLYAVWFQVPEDRLADFDAWYEQDHVPLLMESPDWLMVRRFRINDGEPLPFNRLALHYLADRAALSSPAREKARATPWRARLAAEPWFKGSYSVFEAIRPRQKPAR